MEKYETRLKAVSFLRFEETGYEQAPYEPITKERYEYLITGVTPIQKFETNFAGAGTSFCDGDTCTVNWAALAGEVEEAEEEVVPLSDWKVHEVLVMPEVLNLEAISKLNLYTNS